VFNSAKKGYHRRGRQCSSSSLPIRFVPMPFMNNAAQSRSDSRKCSVPRPSTWKEQLPLSQRSRHGFRRRAARTSHRPFARPNEYSGRSMVNPRIRHTLQHSMARHNQQFVISRGQANLSSMRYPPHSVRLQAVSIHTGFTSIPYSSASQQTVQQTVLPQPHAYASVPIIAQSCVRPVMHHPTQAPLTMQQTMQNQTIQQQGQHNSKQPTLLESADVASSQPEIVCVSPVSSRPSSRQFAYADNSTTAQSTISSRSSLSSESPFVPSETTSITAHRDIYDFRLKREAANIHQKPGLVTRKLREMSLRNTLSLGLERAKSDEPMPFYPREEQHQTHQTHPTHPTVNNSRMSKSQRRRQRRIKAQKQN